MSPSTTTATIAKRTPATRVSRTQATVVVTVHLDLGRLRLVVLTVPWVKVQPMEGRGAVQVGERNGDYKH